MRYKKHVALSIWLATTILSASCGLSGIQEPTATPIDGPVFNPSVVLTPSDTPITLSTPTIIPTTPKPGSPQPTAPTSGPYKMVVALEEVLTGKFETLVSTADGTLWLITDQEVTKIADTILTVYLTNFSGDIAGIDSSGRVWVIKQDGTQISAWNGQVWTTYGVDAGWTALTDNYYQYVSGGQSDLLGWIWFASPQDVRVFDGDRWKVYSLQEMGMEASMYEDLETRLQVTTSRDGTVWVTECDWGGPGPFGGQGVRWLDEGVWQGASSPVASGCATVIADDSKGNIWAGIDSNLWRYDPAHDAWTEFSSPEPPVAEMRFGFFDSLTVDTHDNVWPILVLCGGASCFGNTVLYQFHDELWTQVGDIGEFDYGYWGPIFDANGTPWIYWEGGIYQINGNTPELVSPLTGRSGSVDSSGRVWFIALYSDHDTLWVLDNQTSE